MKWCEFDTFFLHLHNFAFLVHNSTFFDNITDVVFGLCLSSCCLLSSPERFNLNFVAEFISPAVYCFISSVAKRRHLAEAAVPLSVLVSSSA
jgi:hypothetical protein